MSVRSSNLIIVESVDSTNNYATAMIQNGTAGDGDAVFAIEQRSGRGRRGKTWKSRKGENIIVTISVQMQWLAVHKQFYLSMAVALACRDFLSTYCKENIKIKWPNDIFLNDRKAGGILVENIIKGNLWQWAVIGLGLNINQDSFEKDLQGAVSLKQLTGKKYDVIQLARELHGAVLKRVDLLRSGEPAKIVSEYNENLFCRDERVKLKKGNIVFETEVKRVLDSGELITMDVMQRSFGFDEVQWIIS